MTPPRTPDRPPDRGVGQRATARDKVPWDVAWAGPASRTDLQSWLDGQVAAGHLTQAVARRYLPDYQPPTPWSCLVDPSTLTAPQHSALHPAQRSGEATARTADHAASDDADDAGDAADWGS